MSSSTISRHVSVIALCFGICLLSAKVMSGQNSVSHEVNEGKVLLEALGCYECHGYVGQGSRSSGPSLTVPLLPFGAFLRQLRYPAAEMPPYEPSVVSDGQAEEIYAYLKSLPPPADPKTIRIQ
jgi:ubiquinol-cytochrome c reductase cytochrome c subunit